MVFELFFLLCDSETDLLIFLYYRNLNFEIKLDKNEGSP